MLSEKYKPKNIEEFVKYMESIDRRKIELLRDKFKRQEIKKLMIYSEHHGTGKTALAYAIGRDLGYNIIELNIINVDKVDLSEIDIYDIYGNRNLLIVDDIDVILQTYRRFDLNKLFKVKVPVILTCTDYWDKSMAEIRKKIDKELALFELKISKKSYINIINAIAKREGINIENLDNNYPDIRAALNDLELIIIGVKRKINQNIFDILGVIFNSRKLRTYRSVLQYLYENLIYSDYQSLLPLIETNLITSYRDKGLLWVYQHISMADVYMRKSNYVLSEYVPRMIAAISLMSDYYIPSKYNVKTDYNRYTKIPDLELHMSNRKILAYLPLFNLIINK